MLFNIKFEEKQKDDMYKHKQNNWIYIYNATVTTIPDGYCLYYKCLLNEHIIDISTVTCIYNVYLIQIRTENPK